VCTAKDKIYFTKILRILICDIPISRAISRKILHVSFSTAAIITYAYRKAAVLTVCRRLAFTVVVGVAVLSQISASFSETFYCLDVTDQENAVPNSTYQCQRIYF